MNNIVKGENKKYRLTNNTQVLDDGRTVYQIEALVDFADVRAGDLGGYLESERDLNFHHGDNSWVYDESIVAGNGEWGSMSQDGHNSFTVGENSTVRGKSFVDDAWVYGGSVIVDSTVTGSLTEETKIVDSHISNDAIDPGDKLTPALRDPLAISEIRHNPLVENMIVKNSSINETDELSNSTVIHSLTVGTPIVDSEVYGTLISQSSVRDNSSVKKGYLRQVEIDDHSLVDNVIIMGGLVTDRSEVFNSRDINDTEIISSSLNSMGDVKNTKFINTHSQESDVVDAVIRESSVQNSNIVDGSDLSKSDIRLANIAKSTVNNSRIRSSEITLESLDGVSKNDYKTPEVLDQLGIYLDVDDINDLSDGFLEL